ncbi:MAG: winged helix-turn-helix transcriptional regulator [Bacteroidetes bacterium]|nr:winged helix-turn-helix transcriptional regulator [Bacteroidota bacterium]
MGISKSEEFSVRDNRLAEIAKAFAHPARIAILRILINRQSCVCGDIVEELPLSQSTVSQHLKELKAAGIIQGEIDGPRICYCIEPGAWKSMQKNLSDFFELYQDPKEKCCP